MKQLANQIAVVTGASRGLGRAIAWTLAEQGATVVAAARTADKLADLAGEAKAAQLAGTIVPRALDVTDRAAVEAFVEAVVGEFKKIDILVNNAGITRDSLLMNMEDEQFDEVMTANLKSVFWLTRITSRYMVRARYGRIVNISSVSGVCGNAGQSNYAASKAGLIGFSKSVAKEFARRNITCNVIAPGFITTDMTDVLPDKVKEEYKQIIPCRRFGEPADVAAAVAFFASPAAQYITGQVLAVDGGMTM
ncbi:MAG TPA: 3-oxoacyl-[acyl-carrier-protein] reductase [Phycisphaerae bacterium]|nr:3-oxoacyl-[acyl-carrier-protein] reductase [Phycisphaerae bacterium]HOJ75691.1 3-oxoacyl-[acyl-carrier-protein] reductase [Phycisphaerae bacterium]HOM53168.1 3-oxoacyl-[acyl-carrier-protein] reductase [Phycisphaerae bacterium]HOQ87885.1 3-oxoacyl-[acyl-carrier-protein] reductase [Phycisphaerae bacterium]HPP28044.1 3-oxoacyl-[acyl-carrier-protein] reductase [Phycisphaerae bacterium]